MGAYLRHVACSRKDCFANREGCCSVLSNNDFGKRPCPFYKTKEEFLRGQLPQMAMQLRVEDGYDETDDDD